MEQNIKQEIKNNFRIFEYGDEFYVQTKLPYVFFFGIPIGWRYYDNKENISILDIIQLISGALLIIIVCTIIVQLIMYHTVNFNNYLISMFASAFVTTLMNFLLAKFSRNMSKPYFCLADSEENIEEIVNKIFGRIYLRRKIQLEKDEKRSKRKSNRKYHYMYDIQTMRKEKLENLNLDK